MRKPERLDEIKATLERHYADMHAQMRRADNAYHMKFDNPPQVPEGVPLYASSTARSLIDNLTDQIQVDKPRIDFDARGPSRSATEHRELMEAWGRHVLAQIPAHSIVNPMEQAKKDAILRGAFCFKHVVDVEQLPDPPEKGGSAREYRAALKDWNMARATTFAFVVRPIDPLRVFVAPTHGLRPKFVLEVQERRAGELEMDYSEDRPDLGLSQWVDRAKKPNPMRPVVWLEYWDAEHYIVEADGQRIIDKVNPYGFVPYVWAYNGLGRTNFDANPAHLAADMLTPVIGDIEAEVRIKTAADAQWQIHVFPPIITTDDPATLKKKLSGQGGRIITVKQMTEAPVWMNRPPPNPEMMRFLDEIRAAVAARYPPALTQRPEGVEAALHQAMLLGQALKPLLPVSVTVARGVSELLNGLARQAAVMRLTTSVHGKFGRAEKERTVTPDDFTDFNFRVSFEDTEPTEDDRKLLVGLSLLRVPGIISRQTFREAFAKRLIPDNGEEEERVLTEQAIDQAMAGGLVASVLLEEVARKEQEAIAEEVTKAAGEGRFPPTAREQRVEGLGAPPVQSTQEAALPGFEAGGA